MLVGEVDLAELDVGVRPEDFVGHGEVYSLVQTSLKDAAETAPAMEARRLKLVEPRIAKPGVMNGPERD